MRNTFTRFSICLFMGIFYCCALLSQQTHQTINEQEQCGTQQWLEAQFNAYPTLRQQYQQMEQRMGAAVTQKLQNAHAGAYGAAPLRTLMSDAAVFTIPIVFHIVGTSPATITDAQMYALLDTLNKDFGGTNGDSVKILPGFKPVFGKSNIQFCLAQRTPTGAVTNGIMRYTSSTISSSSSTNDPIKSTTAGGADAWNPNRYLNVWIGTFSSSGLLGYASFPINSPENPGGLLSQQGLVIEKGTVPGGTNPPYNNGRVLTHEIGHFFWLRHIWGDATCGDDFPNTPGIDDTPAQSGPSSGCSVGIVSTGCAGTAPSGRMYQNYMDYSISSCMALFSTGQTIRMAVCLDSFRASLKTSNACQPINCPTFTINVATTGTTGLVTVSGGQPPYVYSLDSINYQTSNQFTGLVPGNTYTVYVRDSIFCRSSTSFIASGITVLPLPSALCAGQPLAVSFTTTGSFAAGNLFIAQISNASGSFANPVGIGTVAATGNATINATIRDTLSPGSRYRIRVIATNPAVTGSNNGIDLEIANASVTPAVSISITAGTNPGCSGSSISFRATAVNGGNAPVFQWKRNGADVDTGRIFTTTTLLNNDVITCALLSNSNCATTYTALSNAITLVRAATLVPSLTISADAADTICSGTRVTFTATPVNGGTNPRYQWRRNGVVTADTFAVYSVTNLATNDTITCRLTSSLTCTSPTFAISNQLRFSVIPSIIPALSITSSAGAGICNGTVVSFTATPFNGGVNPSYQWKKNGINVGTNNTFYADSSLVNGDTIRCVMTRSTPAICLSSTTATSNAIRMNIQNCGTQLLSGNAFLKDSYVEVAVGPCGTFSSTVAAPVGFHARGDASGRLGFVADTGKTGWVSYVGDYYLLGTPEEGFGLTVNGVSTNNNLVCGIANVAGAITTVQSGILEKSATWQGTINGLTVTAKTYLPAGALYFVTKVTLTNTSTAPLNNIYYMRNVDPDQGGSTPGSSGSASTYNSIVYQTPNACNRSLVSATARSNGAEYLGLGSSDPRARVSKGGFSNRIAANIWNGFGVTQSGTNSYGDSAIAIAFNIGTLNVNESTSFSYAYILSTADLEKALAATAIDVNVAGVRADVGKVTDVCTGGSIPINLGNTGSYTSWSWTPATGLNTTTGTNVIATITAPVTYTATGTGPCGTVSLNIALNPVTQAAVGNAGAISGPAAPAQGAASVTYSVAPVANATSYVWNVPAGVVFNSSPDSNVINVRMPAGAFCDSISVTPRNACSTGGRSAIGICLTSPYAITPGTVAEVCTVARLARLPFTAVTGSPTFYSIVWDTAAIAAGFVNVTNAILPLSPITITKPITTPAGNYTGRISVGNGSLSSALYSFTVPVVSVPIVVPGITITASTPANICAGTPVTFTATLVNGGTTPILQWRKNGFFVGTGAATYTDNNILNGDSIYCRLVSTAACASPDTVISNSIRFTVSSAATPSITISAPTGGNICAGNTVTFTATAVNAGAAPVFEWKKNGVAVATGTTYTPASVVTGDSISCTLTSNNACSTAVTVNSNRIIINVATVTTPTVGGAVTIDCGQTITLNATPTTPGNIINWYTTASGGTPFARANAVVVTPAISTTYYAEGGSAAGGSGRMVTSIATTGGVVIDHNSITGDDRSGVVISNNYVYCTGDGGTGRFEKNLTGGLSFPVRDGFFSNLATGDLWQLGDATTNGGSFTSGTATRIYRLTENLTTTGTFLNLSQPIAMQGFGFIAAGEGFTIIYNGTFFYRINLNDGTVTNMNGASGFSYQGSEGPASYGWAEFDGTNYFICYAASFTTVARRNVVTGVVTTVQLFSNLGETANIIFDPQLNRMYFHHEGSSQFGGSGETLGYVAVVSTQTVPLCASSRVPVTVTVNAATLTPSVNIVANFSGTVCSNSSVTFTASATNGGATPVYQWRRNRVNVATGVTYTLTAPLNNDTISCQLTSSIFCVTAPVAISNSIVLSVITPSATPFVTISASSSGTVCSGTNILFTAAVSNAGSTPVYQWKKNGLNVGTNSATYIDNANTTGTINCVVTTNTPCSITLTSNNIFITPTAPVQPSVSITSSAGNNICAGTSVTFTATAVNGGSFPLYQWKKNGVNVSTATSYTTTTLVNGDTITCVLTSNALCVTQASVTSNAIGFSVNAAPTINSVANQTVCPGSTLPAVSFSGTGAQYRWTNNNTAIGLAASGMGNLPAFVATNPGTAPITAIISATPLTAGARYAYVANSANNTVSVVNLADNSVAATIPVSASPWAVAATPDGSKVYVSHSGYTGNVSVISTATNQVTATIPVTGASYSMCVSPDGLRLYVSNYSSGYVYAYSTLNNALLNSYYLGNNLYGVAISPDGLKLYAIGFNNVYVITLSGAASTISIPVGLNPTGVIVSPDGSRIYVTNANSNTVSVINAATNTVIASIATGNSPYNLALSPDGRNLYVANNASNNVSVISTMSNEVVATVAAGSAPSGISVNADGTLVYVTNQNSNTVSVISTATNTVTTTLSGFSGPVSWGNFVTSRQGCAGAPITFTIRVTAPNTNTWIGDVDTDWHTAGNWLCGRIPTISDNVVIAVSTKNFYPVVLANDTITIRSIRLEPGTSMRMGTNASLLLTNNQ